MESGSCWTVTGTSTGSRRTIALHSKTFRTWVPPRAAVHRHEQAGAEFDPSAQPLLMSLAAWRSYCRCCLLLKPLASMPGPGVVAHVFGPLKVDSKAVELKGETAPTVPSQTLKTAAELATV